MAKYINRPNITKMYNKVIALGKNRGIVIRTVVRDADMNIGYSYLYDENTGKALSKRHKSTVPLLEELRRMVM